MKELWNVISCEEAWSSLFDRNPHALLVIDPGARRIVAANSSADELYGREKGELAGSALDSIIDVSDGTALVRLTTPSPDRMFMSAGRHRTKEGSSFHPRLHVNEIQTTTGVMLVVTILDTIDSDLIDAASGLPDPRLFLDRLEQSVVHAHRASSGLGVCLIVIDRLQHLLENLRADARRRLLHEIGDRLRANLRESDTVARVGRAEFALIIEGVRERTSILEVLGKVASDFQYEFRVGDEDLVLNPSIGVSVYPQDGHEADMLVENAALAASSAAGGAPARVRFFADG